MSAFPPLATELRTSLKVRFVPEADVTPPISRASLRVWHINARIVSPDGSLALRGINLLALCPLDKVRRTIRWIIGATESNLRPQTTCNSLLLIDREFHISTFRNSRKSG
jgi:hypothetical protein